MTPAEIVAAQLDAYNAKDIEGFMSWWAEDAQIFAHPDVPIALGHAEVCARHLLRFKEPDLRAKLISRTVLGNQVVDTELVTRNFPEGVGQVDVVGIYDVVDGKIARAWFLMGTPRLRS